MRRSGGRAGSRGGAKTNCPAGSRPPRPRSRPKPPRPRGGASRERASARARISRRPARDARSLLCTILGDAADARPPLIPYNPALRPRNRGRRTGRRLERGPQRAWATPLEALLLAERAALLSGRDDGFT